MQLPLASSWGDKLWIRCNGHAVKQEGNITHLLGSFQDITEYINTQRELELATVQSERANKAKSAFLSQMSHELRTPLNAIIGFSQLLEIDTSVSTDSHEYATHIRKAGEHLLGLIEEVLDLSRIETGNIKYDIAPFSVKDEVEQAINLLESTAQKESITIDTRWNSCEETFVNADRLRFKQVLVNLISNAIKYNKKPGEVIVHVRRDNDTLKIEVQDTGLGIPQDSVNKVFEPFERLGAEKSTISGVGIGLSISKQLVERMSGEIGFESEYGNGSTFWFQLPIAKI